MVVRPPHHFYRMTEESVPEINAMIDRLAEANEEEQLDLENIERAQEILEREQSDLDNTFNREYTASFNVSTTSIDWGDTSGYGDFTPIQKSNFDYYGGCKVCWDYSMLFGRTLTSALSAIQNEEDFEKHKMQFVKHYNKEHRDLYEWRKTKKGKKPITDQKEMDRKRERATNHMGTFELRGGSSITFITDEGRDGFGMSPFHALVDWTTRPEITEEDRFLIDVVAARGDITDEDRERINKKYGISPLNAAFKKYRRNVMRRPVRNGWRD